MKDGIKIIFWILVVIGGIYFLFHYSGSSSSSKSSSPSYLPATYDNNDGYEDDSSSMDYSDAISDYWDDIKSYVSGSETIEACSDSSGNCYDLDADISEGCVDEIKFDNGGYLDFTYACFDENGEASDTDEEGNGWSFTIDTNSSIITDAVDEWASDNDYTID